MRVFKCLNSNQVYHSILATVIFITLQTGRTFSLLQHLTLLVYLSHNTSLLISHSLLISTQYLSQNIHLRGGFKKKVYGIFHSGSGPSHPPPLMEKKTWSENAVNRLKWILKSTCFFTSIRPHSPLLDSPP